MIGNEGIDNIGGNRGVGRPGRGVNPGGPNRPAFTPGVGVPVIQPTDRGGGTGDVGMSPWRSNGGLSRGPGFGRTFPGDLPHTDLAPPGGGAGGGGAAPPSPLDSTYQSNVASNLFKTNNQINQLGQQGAYAQTALQAALGKLAYQEPRDALKLEQGANRGGGLFSSVYGQNQGNLQNSYLGRQTGLQQNFQNQEAGRQAHIAALQQGIPLYNEGQYAAAVGRASVAAQKNPATGESAAPLNTGRGRLVASLARGNRLRGPKTDLGGVA